MFASYIHVDISCMELDNPGCECLTTYSSNHMPLMYLFCWLFEMFVSVSWLHTFLLCGVDGILKVVNYFKSSLNIWVMLVIGCGWEILRVVLVSSCLIVHPTKSSSVIVDWIAHYIFINSLLSINTVLSLNARLSSMYTIMIALSSSFYMHKWQGSVFHWLNPALRFIFLMY